MSEAGARQVEKLMQQYGHLPSVPDGPIIAEFNPLELAQAIEHEAERGSVYGWPKITLHMDIHDAVKLAKFLRKA